MARRKKVLGISADQALQAVHVLVHEGKILARDVTRAVERREKLVRQLRARLVELGDEGTRLVGQIRRRGGPRAASAARSMGKAMTQAKRRGNRVLSKAQRVAYQAQGRYMAAVRTLPKTVRVKIREIRKSSGVNAAIKAAKKMAKAR
jgi:adenine/guanine phosphoribosyltransferase-like PRPP-binding protein